MARTKALIVAGVVLSGCAAPSDDGAADPRSVAVYDVARDEFGKGDLRQALAKVNEALSLDGANADAAYLGGIIHLAFCAKDEASSDCRFDEAEKFMRVALDAKGEMRDARNVLGVVLVHQKRFDEAIEVLKPLTEDILYGSPEKSWGNLGWAYLEKGSVNDAVDALRRSVAAQPYFCVGNYRLGLAYEQKKEFQAAREALTRALETDRPGCKTLQEALDARARVAMRLGLVDQARADYESCAEVSKSNTVGTRCLAELQARGKAKPPEPSAPEPQPAPPEGGVPGPAPSTKPPTP